MNSELHLTPNKRIRRIILNTNPGPEVLVPHPCSMRASAGERSIWVNAEHGIGIMAQSQSLGGHKISMPVSRSPH